MCVCSVFHTYVYTWEEKKTIKQHVLISVGMLSLHCWVSACKLKHYIYMLVSGPCCFTEISTCQQDRGLLTEAAGGGWRLEACHCRKRVLDLYLHWIYCGSLINNIHLEICTMSAQYWKTKSLKSSFRKVRKQTHLLALMSGNTVTLILYIMFILQIKYCTHFHILYKNVMSHIFWEWFTK